MGKGQSHGNIEGNWRLLPEGGRTWVDEPAITLADRDPALTLLKVGYRENRSALRIRAATWARNRPVNGHERKISGASTHGHGAPLTWSGGLAVPRQTPSP